MRKNSYTPVAYSVNELISQDLLNLPNKPSLLPPQKIPQKTYRPQMLRACPARSLGQYEAISQIHITFGSIGLI